MASNVSPILSVHRRLGRLRRRVRLLFAVQGLSRWVAGLVLVLVAFFLADWLLDLPLAVRRFVRLGLLDRPEGWSTVPWGLALLGTGTLAVVATRARSGLAALAAFAAGGAAGLLLWAAARFLSPLGVTLPERDLALSVEQRFRGLQDRLAAALDFERELSAPTRGESGAMMRSVIGEAEAAARSLAFTRAVSARLSLRWVAGALLAALGAAGLGFALPETVSLWARRSILLEDRAWPRATTVRAVRLEAEGRVEAWDPQVPYEVAVGRPLTVHAEATGKVPGEVLLLDLGEGGRPFRRPMFPVPGRKGLFQVEIRDVRRAFDFVLQGGDDRDAEPRYRVRIVVPPRAVSLHALLTYPEYLGRQAETVEGGSLEVPQGTRVQMTVEADVPLAEARAVLGDEVIPCTPREGSASAFVFEFRAEETMRYRLVLRTAEGHENDPARETYEVRVEPDRAPQVTWLHPRGPVETTPQGRVPLLCVARDDHAVRDLVLEVRMAGDEVRRLALGPYVPEDGEREGEGVLPANDGPYGRREVRTYLPLEIGSLGDEEGRPPAPPARLAARVVVRDSKGQTREGAWMPIDVYAAADLERSIAGRRGNVRRQITTVLAEQRMRREQMAALLGGPRGVAERDLLKSIQFGQAKVAQDADDAVRGLLEVFNAFVYDRLGAESPNERILSILDRHHRATYGVDQGTGGAEGAPLVAGDPVFPYALYDEVVAAWRRRDFFDSGLLDRMLAVLAEAVDAAARHAPAAHEAAVQVVAVPEEDERLREALDAQDALVASLERVLDLMRNWQSLNDVILGLRRIIEEQEALHERLDEQSQR